LRKVKPLAACAFALEIPRSDDRGTLAAITPVPAQIMHSNAPRRSMERPLGKKTDASVDLSRDIATAAEPVSAFDTLMHPSRGLRHLA
jgi:hypothetical protein